MKPKRKRVVRETRHYSGPDSVEFWKRVNALPQPDHMGSYMLGCVLQELEARVMRFLENAEKLPRVELSCGHEAWVTCNRRPQRGVSFVECYESSKDAQAKNKLERKRKP